jgi:hypothetical protein
MPYMGTIERNFFGSYELRVFWTFCSFLHSYVTEKLFE